MHVPSLPTLISWGTSVVTICSVLHSVLPPWDFLDDFPTAQKLYKVLIYLIGYAAMNGRSTVYKSISEAAKNGRRLGDKTEQSQEPVTDTKEAVPPKQ
jgi:hypothetical protein